MLSVVSDNKEYTATGEETLCWAKEVFCADNSCGRYISHQCCKGLSSTPLGLCPRHTRDIIPKREEGTE